MFDARTQKIYGLLTLEQRRGSGQESSPESALVWAWEEVVFGVALLSGEGGRRPSGRI